MVDRALLKLGLGVHGMCQSPIDHYNDCIDRTGPVDVGLYPILAMAAACGCIGVPRGIITSVTHLAVNISILEHQLPRTVVL